VGIAEMGQTDGLVVTVPKLMVKLNRMLVADDGLG
jgi:hypothetical protein